ncbi:HEAT repeat domain-containing protein [Pseudaquabacterium rugosum]|jgi:HEAT repeat protein|uniref:HEAT repeat domain-containing protein n=1 Tax=Pseudaquabacterium rugosum TaxID=2984194 RepID=A0ABU9BDS7_9BURK
MGLRKTATPEPLREVVERQPPRDLPGLLTQLRSSDAQERRWAARDLGAHPQAATVLGEALVGERDARVRDALFLTLTALASEDAAGALLPLLRSEEAPLRNGAIEALAAMPQAVAPRIHSLLHDADPDVRIFTVNLMGELRHERVRQWLLQVLAEDGSINVVAAAIEVLAEVGQPEDLAALQAVRARHADDVFIGFAIDMAASRIQSI